MLMTQNSTESLVIEISGDTNISFTGKQRGCMVYAHDIIHMVVATSFAFFFPRKKNILEKVTLTKAATFYRGRKGSSMYIF